MDGLEQTDLLRTSLGVSLAQSRRATEYGVALSNSTVEIRREQVNYVGKIMNDVSKMMNSALKVMDLCRR